MNLSVSQIKTALALAASDSDSALEEFAVSLGMSLGELNEHLDLAEQGVGLTDAQYAHLYEQPKLSQGYLEIKKMVELLGDTISDNQWSIFADQARSLPAAEIKSMMNDPMFLGMSGGLCEICAECGIY